MKNGPALPNRQVCGPKKGRSQRHTPLAKYEKVIYKKVWHLVTGNKIQEICEGIMIRM